MYNKVLCNARYFIKKSILSRLMVQKLDERQGDVIRHTKCDISILNATLSKLNATVSRIVSENWGQPTVDKEL